MQTLSRQWIPSAQFKAFNECYSGKIIDQSPSADKASKYSSKSEDAAVRYNSNTMLLLSSYFYKTLWCEWMKLSFMKTRRVAMKLLPARSDVALWKGAFKKLLTLSLLSCSEASKIIFRKLSSGFEVELSARKALHKASKEASDKVLGESFLTFHVPQLLGFRRKIFEIFGRVAGSGVVTLKPTERLQAFHFFQLRLS